MAQAFLCRDQTAKQVARVLWDRYFCVFGFPERIHSDQGANFESQLISELLRVSGVRKSHTTPYHPMGNGSVERFNRTLGGMIRALSPEEKADWPRRLQTLTFMYNCAVHETTGYPPFYLMFGRVPRLPIDVLFRAVLHDSAVMSYDRYVACLANDLKEAMVIAQDHASKEQRRHAQLYNKRIKGPSVDIGDRVLLANRKERGKKKLADRWESTIYTVMDINPEKHTYRIHDTVTGQEKVVHRNLLMLANFLPVEATSEMSDRASSMSDTGSSALETDDIGADGRVLYERENGTLNGASRNIEGGFVGNTPVTAVEMQSPLSGPEPVDSEKRTIEWITQLSAPSLSGRDVTDLATMNSDPQTYSVPPEDYTTDRSVTCDSVSVTTPDVLTSVEQPD
uniref:Integrase catalytic domain-containing protein n=1 Tax=Gouania willdenowi TaxID=441366 RepID=A0A8C5DFV4_GOUWI